MVKIVSISRICNRSGNNLAIRIIIVTLPDASEVIQNDPRGTQMVGDVVAWLQVIPVLHNPAAHSGNALQRYAGREHLLNQTERSGIDILLLHDGIHRVLQGIRTDDLFIRERREWREWRE